MQEPAAPTRCVEGVEGRHGERFIARRQRRPVEGYGDIIRRELAHEPIEVPHRPVTEPEPHLAFETHAANVAVGRGVIAGVSNMCSTTVSRVTLTGQRTFEELGTPLSDVPFCVLDLETTGVAPDTCEITEVGAVRFEGGVETGRFQTLVNPRAAIPPTVTVMTGITQAMVIDAPLIEEVLPSFLEFIGDAVVVGHNVRFDISFINAAAIRLGYPRLRNRSVDTMRLARRLLRSEVRKLSLSSLARHLGASTTPNHRALDDALATADVFFSLLERAGSVGVTHLDDLLALPTIKGSRAINKLSLTERLPRAPGVYVFRNRNGDAIYVGKATNLRSRVRSYFAGDPRRRIDAMLRDLDRIDHVRTISEVDAAVLELRMIHELAPHYNKRSKPKGAVHYLRVTAERFPRLSVSRSTGKGLYHLGPFSGRRQAEAAMLALWDATPIRRCSGPGRGCHFAQLGVCVCPCDGSVTEAAYRELVDSLLTGLTKDPARLADAISSRLVELVEHERFEDAARCRDRWDALSRSLNRAAEWTALQDAGAVVGQRDDVTIEVTHGRLTGAWRTGTPAPLRMVDDVPREASPPTMAASSECGLLWKWLTDPRTDILEVTGRPWDPAPPAPALTRLS